MKKLVPHITIANCSEAIKYYQQIFGGEIKNTQTGDGMEMFKGQEDKLIHAELHINDDCVLYFNDVFSQSYTIGKHLSIILDMSSAEEINSIYEELSKDGTVQMALQDTFWGAKHAVIVDKYGLQWDLNFSK